MATDEDVKYAQAKYRELLSRIRTLRTQMGVLELELRSIKEALRKLEKLDGDSEVYERAGHIFVRRQRGELAEDLESKRQLTSSMIEKYRKEEKESRLELKQLLESLGISEGS